MIPKPSGFCLPALRTRRLLLSNLNVRKLRLKETTQLTMYGNHVVLMYALEPLWRLIWIETHKSVFLSGCQLTANEIDALR